jgi:hypothetical protein
MTTKDPSDSDPGKRPESGSNDQDKGGADTDSESKAFASALAGVTAIKEFRRDVLDSLQQQETDLPRPSWRKKFRRDLPFWSLLSREQQRHTRHIFAHMLPDPDVDVTSFDPDERLMLDVVAEQYIRQALVFAETVESERYEPKAEIDRDFPGRVLVLTFSASLFFFDAPDEYGKRGYTYQNIYGNRSIPATGRCRLKGGFERDESIQSLEFHTSAVQLLGVAEGGAKKLRSFDHESKRFHKSFSDTFHGISVKARDTFSGFVRELTSSQALESAEVEPGDGEHGASISRIEPELQRKKKDTDTNETLGEGDGSESNESAARPSSGSGELGPSDPDDNDKSRA